MSGISKRRVFAFPSKVTNADFDPGNEAYPGMTLRDWFAGMSMMGMTASPALMEAVTGPEAGAGRHLERLARKAYEQADEMMVEREKERTE